MGAARQWGIVRAPDGGFDYADFVRTAIEAGPTENGVFAARIMWGTMDDWSTIWEKCDEDLDADPVSVTRGILRYLDLEPPPGRRRWENESLRVYQLPPLPFD